MSPAHDGSLTINEALELGEIEMRHAKKKTWGHQVAIRFTADDLKKLDKLVNHAAVSGRGVRSATGMYLAPSRSSVIVDLVRSVGAPSTKQLELPDTRQVDLDEAIERSKLAAGVDAIERSSKKLERKSRSPKKAPRGAPKKRRAAITPKRKKQIAAANRKYRAKKKREASR